jgi:hypothetical protein
VVLHDRMPAGYDRAISPTAMASAAPGSVPPAGAPSDSIEAACPNPADLIRHFVCVSPAWVRHQTRRRPESWPALAG